MAKKAAYREVYFIEAPTMSMVKIGCANDPDQRLRYLQIGSPDRLRLAGVFAAADAPDLERVLHRRFAHLRAHGEWFHIDDELRAFITNCTFQREDVKSGRIVWETRPTVLEPAISSITARPGETPRQMAKRAMRAFELALAN